MNNMEENYIGRVFEDIKYLYDLNYRVVRIDGNVCIVTCDYKPDRHNFTLEGGIIVNDYLG